MRRSTLDRPVVIVGVATAWWLLIALVSAANARSRGADGGWDALVTALAAVAGWVPLTVAVYALVRRFPIRRAHWPRGLALHLGGAIAVVVIRALFIYLLDPWIHFYDAPPRFPEVLMHSVENNLFVYWLFVGVGHAVIYARDAMERSRVAAALEVALARAQQAALTATMQPHFLFNTLQAVAELVHRDPEAADRAIVQLSALLRRLIDDGRQEVPLADEIAFTRDYLAIEQMRFGDRLEVRWDVAPALLDVLVPRLSVQPLVENALRHGLWPTGRPGRLTIAAHRTDDATLTVAVTDDGGGLRASSAPSSGHGLRTIRARLDNLYGPRGRLVVADLPGGGARAELVVPGTAP